MSPDEGAYTQVEVRVSARVPMVYACGLAFGPMEVTVPAGHLTEAQLATLQAHPQLNVQPLPVKPRAGGTPPGGAKR